MIKTFLCAAAVIAAPMVTSAATVSPGDAGSVSGMLNGTPLVFSFEPTAATTFNFVVTALGSTPSLSAITFGFSPDVASSVALDTVAGTPVFGFGFATVEDYTSAAPFSVYFFGNGGALNSSITLSYATEGAFIPPAPVPLPAAGGLLALALAGMGGVAATRRRKAA